MSRRSRAEQRLLKEQDTVGMRRAEREEQRDLAGQKMVEAARVKAMRLISEKVAEDGHKPRRIARPGKPLKR